MRLLVCLTLLAFSVLQPLEAAAFENLDFEQAMPVTTGDAFTICCSQQIGDLLPHWNAAQVNAPAGEEPLGTGYYNSTHIGGFPAIFNLFDGGDGGFGPFPVDPLEGQFSLQIDTRNLTSAELYQTGLVPAGSQSIRFFGTFENPFGIMGVQEDIGELPAAEMDVYLGGTKLEVLELNRFASFNEYGANIPAALADSQAELRFSVKTSHVLVLDDIRFSPIPVPEPTALVLLTAGSCILTLRRPRVR